MKPKILLVTTSVWSPAARLAGAFDAVGADVAAVFPRGHALAVSRYCRARYRYRPLAGAASIAEAIIAVNPDSVIPCDDRALALLTSLRGFDDLLARSFGPVAGYRTLMARTPSIEAARATGILAPQTMTVGTLTQLPAALQAVGLPCVMKSDFSWGGDGVTFVATRAEAERAFVRLQGPPSRLRSLVRAMRRDDLHFLSAALHPGKAVVNLQALVAGKPATSVFAARDGKVLAAQHMDVLSWRGKTGPAAVMQRVTDPVMDAAAAKIAARFRLSGLHGLDFVRDGAGVPHLIEVNPRATQICHLPLDADLPAALLGVAPRVPVTALPRIGLFPQILAAGLLPDGVFYDLPDDDPEVFQALSGSARVAAGNR